ncbi:MAG: membrane protein insertion efficiency factor YidD [Anaerolineae bacterium]|jgi:putative membrane protein insertion efficiency factor
MKVILLGLIRLYQLTLSRVLPTTCRFYPSCSHYSYAAISHYGLWRGGWLAVKRLARCHPLNPGGFDPVPNLSAPTEFRNSQSFGNPSKVTRP